MFFVVNQRWAVLSSFENKRFVEMFGFPDEKCLPVRHTGD